MSVPLLAVDIEHSDYHWYEVPPAPEPEKHTVQPPTPPAPEKLHAVQPPAPKVETVFYCRDENGQLIEAGLFFERLWDKRLADPVWMAAFHKENDRKQAEKAARRKAREERLAERRKRKEKRT